MKNVKPTLTGSLQESQEETKEKNKLAQQVVSLNDQLTVLQTELTSVSLERTELNEKLLNCSPAQVLTHSSDARLLVFTTNIGVLPYALLPYS